jgi:hypothetical protein
MRMRTLIRTQFVSRIGQPDDIVDLVRVLVSTESAYVNGVVWLIDGGVAGLARRGGLAARPGRSGVTDCYRALSIAVTRLDLVVWTEWSLT